MKSNLISIVGKIQDETTKAYGFYDGKKTVYIPKSLVKWDQDSKTMIMPKWLAKSKELI